MWCWFVQVFQFVESTPALCVLEGFLQEVDSLLLERERGLLPPGEGGGGGGGRGGGGGGGGGEGTAKLEEGHEERRGSGEYRGERQDWGENMDDEYVKALEVYCLVRQCLLDVRHSWRSIVSVVFKQHGKYAGSLALDLSLKFYSYRVHVCYTKSH